MPLRERITPLQRTVAAHAAGALGSGAVAFVAFANLPQTSGFANPLFWGLLALVTLAGALKPHLGALLAYFALSAALIAGNAPAAGCVLLAATAAWWYFTGRLGDADANATLVPPLAGAFGFNQLTPLVAGFCLPPARAFGALAFSLLVSVLPVSYTHLHRIPTDHARSCRQALGSPLLPVPCDILSFMRAFLAGIAARDCLRPWLYAVAFFVTT